MQHLLYYQRKNEISKEMIWRDSAINQECFIRDIICRRLLGYVKPFVISHHTSKSISLPVYGFTMRNGIKVICRDNFYNWKVSVILPKSIEKTDALPLDLMEGPEHDIGDCYCEGFRKEWVFPTYNPKNPNLEKFTVEVDGTYNFYTLMYFLSHLFPIEIETSLEKMPSKEEIAKEVDRINHEQGVFDTYECGEFGKTYTRNYMSAWELWWESYHYLDNKFKYFTDENGISHKEENFNMDTPGDADRFAELIAQDEEACKIFLSEPAEYNQKY